MSSFWRVTGRIAAPPQIKFTSGGYAKLDLIVRESIMGKDSGESFQDHRITLWRGLAEKHDGIAAGTFVYIEGSFSYWKSEKARFPQLQLQVDDFQVVAEEAKVTYQQPIPADQAPNAGIPANDDASDIPF